MACRTGCPTQDHDSWGDCLRASNIQMSTGDANGNLVNNGWTNKKWNNERAKLQCESWDNRPTAE